MKAWARIWLVVLAMAMALVSSAIPEVLIVQKQFPEKDGVNPNVQLGNVLADYLAEDGRVTPVVWSVTDPLFRGYVEAKVISYSENPTLQQALSAASKLRYAYVLYVGGLRSEGNFTAFAQLYKTGFNRPIWEDGGDPTHFRKRVVNVLEKGKPVRKEVLEPDLQSRTIVNVGGLPDWQSTVATVTGTWAAKLATDPFHSFPTKKKIADPATEGGAAVKVDVAAADDKALGQAKAALAAGESNRAILFLREAIDVDPSANEPRALLVDTLLSAGLARQAADEAQRASKVATQPLPLLLAEASAWLQVPDSDKAQTAINESMARGAKGGPVSELQGDVYLLNGEYAKASESYTTAIESGGTFSGRLGHALASAMLGQTEACEKDMQALPKASPEEVLRHYGRAVQLVDRMLLRLTDDLRQIPQKARVQPKNASLIEDANRVRNVAEALTKLIAGIPVPERHAKSHAARDLAHKLLLQASEETLEYAKTANEDISAEAVMSFGEALKLLAALRDVYDIERRHPITSSQ